MEGTTPATPVVEARAVPPSDAGEGLSSRMAALNANCASRRAELETAEADLARHRMQVAEYAISDEPELDALLTAIAEDVEAHVASEKPFVRKLALAVATKNKADRALSLAEEAVRDVNLTPGQLKAESASDSTSRSAPSRASATSCAPRTRACASGSTRSRPSLLRW